MKTTTLFATFLVLVSLSARAESPAFAPGRSLQLLVEEQNRFSTFLNSLAIPVDDRESVQALQTDHQLLTLDMQDFVNCDSRDVSCLDPIRERIRTHLHAFNRHIGTMKDRDLRKKVREYQKPFIARISGVNNFGELLIAKVDGRIPVWAFQSFRMQGYDTDIATLASTGETPALRIVEEKHNR